jgi:copper ion binding protein
MAQAAFTVAGMTCGHCVSSVTEEISELTGVQQVDVELETGQVTVISDQPLSPDAIRAAVTEAGYQLAS